MDKDGFDKFRDPEDENKGYGAVTTKSFLICRHGGIIEPLDSGQVMIEVEESQQENIEIPKENINPFVEEIPFIAAMVTGSFIENGINAFSGKKRKASKIITGAFNSNTKIEEKGLGKLKNIELKVSKKGIDTIKEHLNLFEEYLPNKDMIERLEKALNEDKSIKGADAIFYTHELKENSLMKKFLKVDKVVNNNSKEFIEVYDYAHNKALEFYNVSAFSVYHKEVILKNEDEFNPNWLKFWNNLEN